MIYTLKNSNVKVEIETRNGEVCNAPPDWKFLMGKTIQYVLLWAKSKRMTWEVVP